MQIQLDDRRRRAATSCALAIGLVLVPAFAACGDNEPGIGPAIERADSMFIVAHLDDDMLFMQPELVEALAHGSATTVYVLSGDPIRGNDRARYVFEATMIAYEHVTGSSDWACGSLEVTGLPVHHCRLRDRPVSMIGLDVVDGGRGEHERFESILHLVEGKLASLPILGPVGGEVTIASLVDELAELIALTAPSELHVLDIAANHGDDHPGHLMTGSFALWGAAQAGYTGTLISHRGYNVGTEAINLSDIDYALAKPMLGYFEACYLKCGPCGTECPTISDDHEKYLRRQYSTIATPGGATDRLESDDTPGACLALTGGALGLADCAGPDALAFDADRHLRRGELCATSGPSNGAPITLVPCANDPAQYWLVDDEGFVANGRPPLAEPDMRFDHTRCLQATPGTNCGAPVCGSRRHPRWRVK